MHVKKGDTVVVISGKDRGRKGKVVAVQLDRNRVIVEGINMVKRHTKPSRRNTQGGIISQEAPVHASNVLLFCSRCNAPSRAGRKVLPGGEKVRFCRRCGEEF
ncbi:MAG: 50S ribosomal protein L24 [Clostridia bacterium]|nr:MAG: 50S ribosomal protein L24 [Clostridia bacterium]